MKFIKDIPITNKEKREHYLNNGWSRLKEPKGVFSATIISLPFVVMLIGIVIALILVFDNDFFNFFEDGFHFVIRLDLLILGIIGLYIYTLIHEVIHLIFIPNFMTSSKSYLGIKLAYGFVFTEEVLTKNRFILISIMPYIILSILPTILLGMLGQFNGFALFLILINAAGSCVDFLNVFLVLKQVPKEGNIVNNGMETYYK